MYNINRFMEHTLLDPQMRETDLFKLVEEALEHEFLGICVPPFWVKKAARELEKNSLLLVSVVGYPFGFNLTETKMDEIQRIIENGANEVDVVMNHSTLRCKHPWTKIELAKCSNYIHQHDCLMKVIINVSKLSEIEIRDAVKICKESGTDFVKISFDPLTSANIIKDTKQIRSVLPSNVGVKVSGNISDLNTARQLINFGADRLETTHSVKIMQELQKQEDI